MSCATEKTRVAQLELSHMQEVEYNALGAFIIMQSIPKSRECYSITLTTGVIPIKLQLMQQLILGLNMTPLCLVQIQPRYTYAGNAIEFVRLVNRRSQHLFSKIKLR